MLNMLRFFVSSIFFSSSECFILSILGITSITSSWAITKGFGYEPFSLNFCFITIILSFFLLWISVFWINVLFIPVISGKISLLSPLPSPFFQIPYNASRLTQIVAGFWLTIWLLVITIGWSLVLKENPITHHLTNKTPYKRCCGSNQNNFYIWYENDFLPMTLNHQNKSLSNRKFIVYQPSVGYSYTQILNGLYTAFVLAMITNREFLINTDEEFSSTLKKPGYNWIYKEVFVNQPSSISYYDLSLPPSYIIRPLFKWETLLLDDINSSFMLESQVICIDAKEFLVPFFYANPNHRKFLCKICDVSNMYTALSKKFLQFTDDIIEKSNSILTNLNTRYAISLMDISNSKRIRQMVDTSLRCLSKVSTNDNLPWLIFQLGNTKKKILKFKNISNHQITIFTPDNILFKYTREFHIAMLYYVCSKADYIVSFSEIPIGESISLAFNIPTYIVYKNYPICADVAVKLPCIKSWKRIIGSITNNFDKIMIAEFINQYKCYL